MRSEEDAMISQVKTFLRNLTEVPEGIFPQSFYKPITRRAINFGYDSYLTASLWHTVFIFIWLFLQVYLMTFIGVLAALFYIAIYYLQRRGFFLTALFSIAFFLSFINLSVSISVSMIWTPKLVSCKFFPSFE